MARALGNESGIEGAADVTRGIEDLEIGPMVPGIRMLAPSVFFAGVLPLIGYVLLRPHVGSDAVGLAAISVFPLGEVLWGRLRLGRFEPIGLIVLVGLVAGLVGALAFRGDTFMLKVRESMITGLFGVVCLATVGARRPVMFPLGRYFSTGGDPARMAEFDTLWDLPGVAWRFRVVTAVWGVALVAEAAARTILVLTVSTSRLLELGPVLNVAVIAGLLWFTSAFSRSGEQRVRRSLGLLGDEAG